MSEILDSGVRREFDSGAVRDIAEGKGRMDLMPLDVIADFCDYVNTEVPSNVDLIFDFTRMFSCMAGFMQTGSKKEIYKLISAFVQQYYLSLGDAILDLSIHYEQGAKKYCERNWEKGIDAHCFVDSALRHGTKLLRGDKDEPHDRAFMWNLFGLLWTLRHKPELNDLPFVQFNECQSDRTESFEHVSLHCGGIIEK